MQGLEQQQLQDKEYQEVHTRSNHPLSLYIPGKSQPETPMDRLVVLGWKSNEKTGRKAYSARCFSLPKWTPELSGKDQEFVELLVEAVVERQKKAAHRYVTNFLDSNQGVCQDLPHSVVSPESILKEFQKEQEDSSLDGSRGKLSSEQIEAWYQEKLALLVMERVASSKGWLEEGYQMSEEEEKKCKQASNGYKATLAKLAAPTPSVNIQTAEALKKALELLGEEEREMDTVARKLERKLEAILAPRKSEVAGLELL